MTNETAIRARLIALMPNLADAALYADDIIADATDDETDLAALGDDDLRRQIVIFLTSMLEDQVFAGDTDLREAQGMIDIALIIDPALSNIGAELRDMIRDTTDHRI